MAETNLKDLFKQAADIAKDVPESMQEAAFNRALDFLLGLGSSGAAGKKRVAAPTRRTQGSQESPDDEVDTLLQQLDRTAHPKILDAPRVLDRSLALLRIARDEFSIDGLSAPQIARVLTEKFRFRTSRQAVTQALATAIDKVDRVLEDGEVR